MVMPFKPIMSKWETTFTYNGQPLTIGKVIVHLLNHLIKEQSSETVKDVQTCKVRVLFTFVVFFLTKQYLKSLQTEMFNTIQSFLQTHSQTELHAIQCDVEKCYDRLSINQVFKNAQKQISKFLQNQSFLLARKDESGWSFRPSQQATSGDISLHCSLLIKVQWLVLFLFDISNIIFHFSSER